MLSVPIQSLVNFTQFDWEQGFSSNISSIQAETTEYLHHSVINIILCEEAFIYVLISSLIRELERHQERHQGDELLRPFAALAARSFRCGLIATLDIAAIFVHSVIIDEETVSQYPLRIDGVLLIFLNLMFFVFLP